MIGAFVSEDKGRVGLGSQLRCDFSGGCNEAGLWAEPE